MRERTVNTGVSSDISDASVPRGVEQRLDADLMNNACFKSRFYFIFFMGMLKWGPREE